MELAFRVLAATSLVLGPGVAAADESIPFREAWGWAVVVPVAFGGSGVYELLLDTGTSSTILEPGLAEQIGLDAASSANLVTPAGKRPVALGSVDLRLGGTRLESVEVLVAELPAIRGDEPRIRGILGQSALARLEYTIDYARRRLVVHGADGASAPAASPPARRPVLDARLGCGACSTRASPLRSCSSGAAGRSASRWARASAWRRTRERPNGARRVSTRCAWRASAPARCASW